MSGYGFIKVMSAGQWAYINVDQIESVSGYDGAMTQITTRSGSIFSVHCDIDEVMEQIDQANIEYQKIIVVQQWEEASDE